MVDGVTGLLVPSRDSENLGKALQRLLTDIQLSQKMGEAGRKRANELYIESKVVKLQIVSIQRLMEVR